MSNLRRLMYGALSGEKDLTFGVAAFKGGVATCSVYTYSANEPVTIYWGDDTFDTVSGKGYVSATHTYINAIPRAIVRLACGGSGLFRLKFAGDGIDVIDSNEKWYLHPFFDKVEFDTKTYTVNFSSLPRNANSLNYTYQNMVNALLPLKTLPPDVTTMAATFSGDITASLPFRNLPPGLITGTNAFSECVNAVSTITELPDTLINGSGIFNKCSKMDIRLSKFPPSISTLKQSFAYTNAVINLDEIVANAPEGGFISLTDITEAFHYAPGVTGSRSRFLAVCPNVTNTINAFVGTNTTE